MYVTSDYYTGKSKKLYFQLQKVLLDSTDLDSVLAKSLQSCLTLCDPMKRSPPGSYAHGILQARILEWVGCPPPGDLPNPGIEPASLKSPALAGRFFISSSTWEIPSLGAIATEPKCCPHWSQYALKPMLCHKRSHRSEKSMQHSWRAAPHLPQVDKSLCSNEDPTQPRKKENTS